MAIISAFQAEDEGSILSTRSKNFMEHFNRNLPPLGKVDPERLLKLQQERDARIKESFASVEHLDIELFPEIVALIPAIEAFFNQYRKDAGLNSITIGKENVRLIDSAVYENSDIINREVQAGSPAFYDRLNRFAFISIDQKRYKEERQYQAYIVYALLHEMAHLSMEDNGIAKHDHDDLAFIMNEAVADLLAKELYANIRPSILDDEETARLENRWSLDEINFKLLKEYNGLIQVDASEIVFIAPGRSGEETRFSRIPEMKILEILDNAFPGYRNEVMNYALNGDPEGFIAASKARFAGESCAFIVNAHDTVTEKLRRLRQLYPLR